MKNDHMSDEITELKCQLHCSSERVRELTLQLRLLRDEIIENALDVVWVDGAETACERITSILGDDWGKNGDTSSLRSRRLIQGSTKGDESGQQDRSAEANPVAHEETGPGAPGSSSQTLVAGSDVCDLIGKHELEIYAAKSQAPKEVSPGNWAHECPKVGKAGFAGLLHPGDSCRLCGWAVPAKATADYKAGLGAALGIVQAEKTRLKGMWERRKKWDKGDDLQYRIFCAEDLEREILNAAAQAPADSADVGRDGYRELAANRMQEIERLRAALEKLRDGPGRDMAGWKMTWAHEFAKAALEDDYQDCCFGRKREGTHSPMCPSKSRPVGGKDE